MLSIRTQDRMTLVPYTNQIFIDECSKHETKTDDSGGYLEKTKFNINMYIDKVSYIQLGRYATKERALEVLDEIVKYVLGKIIITKQNYVRKDWLEVGTSPYAQEEVIDAIQLPQVYQMPKEE